MTALEQDAPVLVVGASGPTGGIVTRALADSGVRVRGLARDADARRRALANGAAEVAAGDLRDDARMVTALTGARAAFYFCPRASPDEAAIGRAFLSAAERAGVERIVSISMIQSHAPVPNHRASLELEEAMARSPLQTTVLQPAMFMQTMPSLRELAELGWIGRPYSIDAPLSWVDLHDVAQAAVMALTTDELVNGTFELCSSGMLSQRQLAALISEHLGQEIVARQVTMEDWAAVRGEAFSSPYRRETYVAMFEHFDRYGYKGGNSFVLRQILGREPTSFAAFVAAGGKDRAAAPLPDRNR
jgi:uncharacterized protein YbjT (DUF2867 family)